MKTFGIALASAALIFTAGCSGGTPDASAPTVTVQAEDYTTEQPEVDLSKVNLSDEASERLFIKVMRDSGGRAWESDEEMVEEGKDVCHRLFAGEDVFDLAYEAVQDDDAGFGLVMGAAVPMFCPQFHEDVESFLSSAGE